MVGRIFDHVPQQKIPGKLVFESFDLILTTLELLGRSCSGENLSAMLKKSFFRLICCVLRYSFSYRHSFRFFHTMCIVLTDFLWCDTSWSYFLQFRFWNVNCGLILIGTVKILTMFLMAWYFLMSRCKSLICWLFESETCFEVISENKMCIFLSFYQIIQNWQEDLWTICKNRKRYFWWTDYHKSVE